MLIKVYKFNPSIDQKPSYNIYQIPLQLKGITVLKLIFYIYENYDGKLAFRHYWCSGRGICGSCMMLINGKATLACQKKVEEDMIIEPLPGFEVLRDLVVDFSARQKVRSPKSN